jgi:hypothetical protein
MRVSGRISGEAKEAGCPFLQDENLEYIGLAPHPRIPLAMELLTSYA